MLHGLYTTKLLPAPYAYLFALFCAYMYWQCACADSARLWGTDSGVLLINTRKRRGLLRAACYLNAYRQARYLSSAGGLHGDKDTYHLAAILLGESLAMVPTVPALLGVKVRAVKVSGVIVTENISATSTFCANSLLHFAPSAPQAHAQVHAHTHARQVQPIFVHATLAKKGWVLSSPLQRQRQRQRQWQWVHGTWNTAMVACHNDARHPRRSSYSYSYSYPYEAPEPLLWDDSSNDSSSRCLSAWGHVGAYTVSYVGDRNHHRDRDGDRDGDDRGCPCPWSLSTKGPVVTEASLDSLLADTTFESVFLADLDTLRGKQFYKTLV